MEALYLLLVLKPKLPLRKLSLQLHQEMTTLQLLMLL
jgi:hypothetical protein